MTKLKRVNSMAPVEMIAWLAARVDNDHDVRVVRNLEKTYTKNGYLFARQRQWARRKIKQIKEEEERS